MRILYPGFSTLVFVRRFRKLPALPHAQRLTLGSRETALHICEEKNTLLSAKGTSPLQ